MFSRRRRKRGHRDHAEVEDCIRTGKAMGLHDLPSQSWQINTGWMLAVNLAADLDAWLRLLALHDSKDLAGAEPDTMRFRLYHLPARLADHARRRCMRIERTWPWAKAGKLRGWGARQVGLAHGRLRGPGDRPVEPDGGRDPWSEQ